MNNLFITHLHTFYGVYQIFTSLIFIIKYANKNAPEMQTYLAENNVFLVVK